MLLSSLRYNLLALLLLLRIAAGARPLNEPTSQSLEFTENKGQWDARARYAAELPAGRLFLGSTGFTYAFVDPAALQAHHDHTGGPLADKLRAHAYTMTFEGGNAKASIQPENPTTEHHNYFLGQNTDKWASNARGFRQLRYAQVYPGIDVQLYENALQRFEYDFLVQPKARPEQIRLRYTGPQALALDGSKLVISTSVGTVTELAPQAWQQQGAERVAVPCAFELHDNVVSFKLGRYNHRLPLTIDPTVLFSSFTGSSADNWGFTATYDQQGNMYAGGIVFGIGYPVSPGAYDTSYNGGLDIGIIKYNTSVSGTPARLYATYIGGRGTEAPHSMVVNSLGELVILGSTSSDNYPVTTAAYDPSFNGGPNIVPLSGIPYNAGSDLIISKLSADGAALTASTFLGGTGTDGVLLSTNNELVHNYGDQFRGDLITDGDGNVYLASSTSSLDFPTPNGFQKTYQGGASDAVVCKLSADLHSLLWSTLLGSPGSDAAYSIQLDAARNVYVSGGTDGAFPTTPGSFRPVWNKSIEGFVAHLSSGGSTLLQATYLGTSTYDQAYFLQLDAASNVYILGQTDGFYPISPDLKGPLIAGQFIQKLNSTLSTGIYSTTFGPATTTTAVALSPTAFLVDDCERIYISGWGGRVNYDNRSIANFPVTPDAIQPTSDGSDFYLAQFTPGMKALEYATFYGENGGRGEHVDGGTSRFDKRGIVYQAVCGGCGGTSGFPTPPNANTYSVRNNSQNCNTAAFKIDFGIVTADPGPTRFVCVNSGPILLGGSPAGGVWTGPGVTARAGGGYQFTPSAALLGRNTLTYSVASTGICVSTRAVRFTVTPNVPATFTPLPALCVDGNTVTLTATPPGGTFSGPGVTGNTFTPSKAGVGSFTLAYTLSDTLSCSLATQVVLVRALPEIEAGPDTTLCSFQQQPFLLKGATPAGGTWSGPGVTPAGLFTPPNTNNKGANLILRYSASADGCVNSDTRKVTLAPSSASNVALDVPECPTAPQYTGLAPLRVSFAPSLLGGSFTWNFGDGSTSTEATPTHVYAEPGLYQVELTAQYASCVVLTQFAPVSVGAVFVPNIITPNGDQLNETFQPRFSCLPARLQVFTRWGNKVFETADYHNDWRGQGLADGVYYYHLLDAEGRKAKGWVEIKR